jgi:hypothetical protein
MVWILELRLGTYLMICLAVGGLLVNEVQRPDCTLTRVSAVAESVLEEVEKMSTTGEDCCQGLIITAEFAISVTNDGW